MFEDIAAKYPDDEMFVYVLRENPRSLTLNYWRDHFEMRFLKEVVSMDERVFDYGCGSGCMDVILNDEGYHIFGYDESKALIEVARRHNGKVSFYDRFPVHEYYERVWMCHVIEHIPEKQLGDVFDQFHPKIPILISTPLGYGYDDGSGHHVNHWFTKEALEQTLSHYVHVDWVAEDPAYSVLRAQVWLRS